MTSTLFATLHITGRRLRFLMRQPFYLAMTLVQPLIWLLLFGQLFKRITQMPGFDTGSYITYLTPGVVVMTALFSSGWSGMSFVTDMERGIMNRFLVLPVRRVALIAGTVIFEMIVVLIQALIMIGLGLILGARFPGGVLSLIALIGCTMLIGAAFASFSNGVALHLRQGESVIALVTFLQLPLTFLSTTFMAQSLMPHWIRVAARFNPVNWAVVVGRQSLGSNVDWTFVALHIGYLVALALACGWFSVRAFRGYQRSI
ncbi:MAG TPA: ABC transporter permease [Nitrolancea sp.]|nr:ABC transporter permease [Nitrolancea sp.]